MALQDAINSGSKWDNNTITYTFNDADGNIPSGAIEQSNEALFNTDQQNAAKSIFSHISDLTNLSFAESPTTAKIAFLSADLIGFAGYAYYPNEFWGSDVIIDNSYNSANPSSFAEFYSLTAGNYGYLILLHEIGHAMGLDHPHEGTTTLAAEYDNFNSTVMSYNPATSASIGGAVATGLGPNSNQTYQILDIAVLQELYGANTSYNAGNTIYSFDNSYNVMTIWDGAGSDVISANGHTSNVTIDLREGVENVTTIGNSSIWIAYNANIEDATGGAGSDIIKGNGLANTLKGLSGNDNIMGNAGDDWVNGNAGNDTITGNAGDDQLRGGKDFDNINGGAGADFINGNNSNDTVYGGTGNDILHGGKEDDIIYGDSGDDRIYGDLGNDSLTGGNGADIFIVKTTTGADIILDFITGTDRIEFKSTALTTENITDSTVFDASGATITISADASILLSNIQSGGFVVSDFDFV